MGGKCLEEMSNLWQNVVYNPMRRGGGSAAFSSCRGSPYLDDTVEYINLKDAIPTDTERDVYDLIRTATAQASELLEDVRSYGAGASVKIADAIRHPSDGTAQKLAWEMVVPLIQRQKMYFLFGMNIEKLIGVLLWELGRGPISAAEALESRAALAGQLAALLSFALRFDGVKMRTPALQNDFSYFRRTRSRMEAEEQQQQLRFSSASSASTASSSLINKERRDRDQQQRESSISSSRLSQTMANNKFGCVGEQQMETHQEVVSNDEANLMSFFYAQATPMMDKIKQATAAFIDEDQLPMNHTLEIFASMAHVCHRMITTTNASGPTRRGRENPSTGTDGELEDLHLRTMTGVCVLYDLVAPNGVFHTRTALIDIISIIETLKSDGKSECDKEEEAASENCRQEMLNVLRYQSPSLTSRTSHSSSTLSSSTVPKHVRSMLMN